MPNRLAKDRPEISHGSAQPVVGMETRDYIRRRRSSLISRNRPYPEEISGAMPPKWQLPNAGHATEPTFKLARFDLRPLARTSCFADFAQKCLPNERSKRRRFPLIRRKLLESRRVRRRSVDYRYFRWVDFKTHVIPSRYLMNFFHRVIISQVTLVSPTSM